MEEIDRKYAVAFRNYASQFTLCSTIKKNIQIFIEEKISYENQVKSLKEELYQISLINSMNKIKGREVNYGFNSDQGKKKKAILESEISKFKKKMEPITQILVRVNAELLENVKYQNKNEIIFLY